MSVFFNTCILCFANARGADMCFDFDLVNQNCLSGRSWSGSGQQGDVAQVFPETHVYLGEPLFSVVPPVALGAAAHAGSAGTGQSRTWHIAFHNTSPWSLVKIEVRHCQHTSVTSEVGHRTVCVTAGLLKACFTRDVSNYILCFLCSWHLFTTALVTAQGAFASPMQKALGFISPLLNMSFFCSLMLTYHNCNFQSEEGLFCCLADDSHTSSIGKVASYPAKALWEGKHSKTSAVSMLLKSGEWARWCRLIPLLTA